MLEPPFLLLSAFELLRGQGDYRLRTRIANDPDFIFPRRSPAAGASNSAEDRNMLWIFGSRPMVRALFFVGTFSTVEYLNLH